MLRSLERVLISSVFFFFFNDTATTEIYTLSLHDALPILSYSPDHSRCQHRPQSLDHEIDRKSTRLNSSHGSISYAVFCLQKNKTTTRIGLTMQSPQRACRSFLSRPRT